MEGANGLRMQGYQDAYSTHSALQNVPHALDNTLLAMDGLARRLLKPTLGYMTPLQEQVGFVNQHLQDAVEKLALASHSSVATEQAVNICYRSSSRAERTEVVRIMLGGVSMSERITKSSSRLLEVQDGIYGIDVHMELDAMPTVAKSLEGHQATVRSLKGEVKEHAEQMGRVYRIMSQDSF